MMTTTTMMMMMVMMMAMAINIKNDYRMTQLVGIDKLMAMMMMRTRRKRKTIVIILKIYLTHPARDGLRWEE